MKIKSLLIAFFITLIAFSAVQSVFAAEHRLYTLSGFVEVLISKGIIAENYASKARNMVAMVTRVENVDEYVEQRQVRNADKLEVKVSQYIEQSSLTFNKFEDVTGLVLIAKNMSTSTEFFEAKRGCQVVYKIYSDEGALLYDSAKEDECNTDEVVTYAIKGEQSRVFEIKHTQGRYALQSGIYRFEIEYPGYGKGERTVTIK